MRFTQDNLDYDKQQFDDVVTEALSAIEGEQVDVVEAYLNSEQAIAIDDMKVLKNLVCYYEILSGENQSSDQGQEAKTNAEETLIKEVIAKRKDSCLGVIGQADVAAQEPITLDDLYVIDTALQIESQHLFEDRDNNLVKLISQSPDFPTKLLCGLAQSQVKPAMEGKEADKEFLAFSVELCGVLGQYGGTLVRALAGTDSAQAGDEKLKTIHDNLTNLPTDSLSQLQSNVKNWAQMKATVSTSLLPSATKEEKEARTRTSSLGSHNSSGRTTPTDAAVALDTINPNDNTSNTSQADNEDRDRVNNDSCCPPNYCESVTASVSASWANHLSVASWVTTSDNSTAMKVAGFIPSAGTNLASTICDGSNAGRNVYATLDFLAGGFALFLIEAIAALIPPLQTAQDGSWSLKSKKALSLGRGGLIDAAVGYGLFALVALAIESQHNQNNFSCVTGKGWEQAVVWDFKDCVYSCELDKKRLNATFFNESLPLGKVTFGENVTELVNFDRQCKSFKGKLEGATCVVEPKDTATKTVPLGAFSFLYRLSVSNNHTFMGQKTAQCDLFGQLIVSGQGVNHTTPTPPPAECTVTSTTVAIPAAIPAGTTVSKTITPDSQHCSGSLPVTHVVKSGQVTVDAPSTVKQGESITLKITANEDAKGEAFEVVVNVNGKLADTVTGNTKAAPSPSPAPTPSPSPSAECKVTAIPASPLASISAGDTVSKEFTPELSSDCKKVAYTCDVVEPTSGLTCSVTTAADGKVTLKVMASPDAEPGDRSVKVLATPQGEAAQLAGTFTVKVEPTPQCNLLVNEVNPDQTLECGVVVPDVYSCPISVFAKNGSTTTVTGVRNEGQAAQSGPSVNLVVGGVVEVNATSDQCEELNHGVEITSSSSHFFSVSQSVSAAMYKILGFGVSPAE